MDIGEIEQRHDIELLEPVHAHEPQSAQAEDPQPAPARPPASAPAEAVKAR